MRFADNLTELRKYHDFSQEELADRISVSRQTLSKYETGESLPDIEKCKLLADVFGVTIDDLISYNKDEQENAPVNDLYDAMIFVYEATPFTVLE